MANRVLGRGLASLIPDRSQTNSVSTNEIELDKIKSNPHQPRKKFSEQGLQELAESIKEHGVLQPIVVTRCGQGYELIAGERRTQASRLAGLKVIPAIIRNATDQQKLEIALIENIQRHNLNPLEEATAYGQLMSEFSLVQQDVARRVGKSRAHVANLLRVLTLPDEIKNGLTERKITLGHAKVLLSLASSTEQLALYNRIIREGLTVRSAESNNNSKKKIISRNADRDPIIADAENSLRDHLNTKVQIKASGNKGKIVVDYYSKEEFNALLDKLSGN